MSENKMDNLPQTDDILKTIGNLIEQETVDNLTKPKYDFLIPSYQRGYRWTRLQIENLLNDINDFDEKKDGDFYCLQPLVVRQKEDKWHVIDGQQRLTTIYLILKAIKENNSFSLRYDRDSFIDETDKSSGVITDSMELYYLTTAKVIIKEWVDDNCKDDDSKKNFSDKLLSQTKFIFYDVGDISDEQEHNIFNNLNSGKIALTNAELIKALFLNKVGKEDIKHREVEQRLLADEFDQIERALRRDDFWYFLAGNKEKPSSCINLLFDLMFDAADDNKDDNNKEKYPQGEVFRTFFYFNDKIKSYEESKKLWEEIKETFYILEGWFNDSTIYNLIGYHRASKAGKNLCDIYKEYKKTATKNDFKNWLIEECKASVNCSEDNPEGFMELKYNENKDKVFNLLLLFNVFTLNEKPEESVKFSFANFHKYKWDIEHISPQKPKEVNNDIEDALKRCPTELNDEEKKYFFALDENDLMGIQNLTLLTSHDNRGIGNGFFFEKRKELQKYYETGSFIPLCSMNVFMKFYSSNPTQMLFWDAADREAYKDKIQKVMNKYFNPSK